MADDRRLEAIVHGFVQGVFFRYHTRIEATRLGLVGTVQNLPDGTVRVVAEGPGGHLDQLLSWLRHGPELAVVERVDAKRKGAAGDLRTFDILR